MNATTLKHIDIFSGIGGFALAARWAGIETIIFCESDPFCRKVLKKNFPKIPICNDVKDFCHEWLTADTNCIGELQPEGGKQEERSRACHCNKEYILTGGFPCQPFSIAGKRRASADDRFLWKEMLRVIREISPVWIIAENVLGILDAEQGVVFESICSDLEMSGYTVQPFVIPACGVGAPHRRDRVWIIAANPDSIGGCRWGNENYKGEAREIQTPRPDSDASDSDSINGNVQRLALAELSFSETTEIFGDKDWAEVAAELCGMDDGLPKRLDKGKRLKSLGNAIVPQIAEIFFKIIKSIYEHHDPHTV